MATPLKRRIVELDTTNKDLARAIQIDLATMSLIVTGKRIPSVDKAIRIARELDSTVEDLFGWTVVNQ